MIVSIRVGTGIGSGLENKGEFHFIGNILFLFSIASIKIRN